MNYLPQMRFDFCEIDKDGQELPTTALTEARLMLSPLNSSTNNPLTVSVEVNKTLGSLNDNASVTIQNSPIIEEFRRDYEAVLADLKDKYFRVRIWAWYQAEGQPPPAMSPVFVGDIVNSFGVKSQGLNDSSFQFVASTGGWLAKTNKYKKTYEKVSYLDVVTDLFDEILARGYGNEAFGGAKKHVICDPEEKLKTKEVVKPLNVDRNPISTLNDICSDMDMVWGMHLNHPYIIDRAVQFGNECMRPQDVDSDKVELDYKSGLRSMIDYGVYDFGFSSLINNDLILGNAVIVDQSPQVSVNNPVYGRINEISYSLSTKKGHKCSLTCAYLEGGSYVSLQPINSEEGGQSYE